MSLHRQLSEKLPDKEGAKTIALAVAAVVLVSIVGIQVASLWFATPVSRTCYSMGVIVEEIASRLERSPDRDIGCENIYGLLLLSPPKLVEHAPWYASLVSTAFGVSKDLEDIATKIVKENCREGNMKQGDLAAAIRREFDARCR